MAGVLDPAVLPPAWQPVAWALAAALLLAICRSDLRTRRIPNAWVLGGLVGALLVQQGLPAGAGLFSAATPGGLGAGAAALGALAAFGAFLVLHLLRTVGAGDVKLMAFVGALFGIGQVLELLLTILLVGGLASVAVLAASGERRRRALANTRHILAGRMVRFSTGVDVPDFDASHQTAFRLPYAIPIAVGAAVSATTLYLDLDWLGIR